SRDSIIEIDQHLPQIENYGERAHYIAGARTPAVSMQTKSTLALTPTLSPREREKQSRCLGRSPRDDRFQHGENVLPLLGERAGVRASVLFICIDTASVRSSSRMLHCSGKFLSPPALEHCCGLKSALLASVEFLEFASQSA